MNLQENIKRIKSLMLLTEDSELYFSKVLKVGSRGNEVSELQKLLGIYEDGKFGPQTKKCVEIFQDNTNIKVDGIVGPETSEKLFKLDSGEISIKLPDWCKTEGGVEGSDKKTNAPKTEKPKTEKPKTEKKPTEQKNSGKLKGNYIIEKNNNSNNFAIIIGGTPSSSYGAKFMKKQADSYLGNKNIIYSDWENNVDSLINVLREQYPQANVKSVTGYSKGGLRAWPSVNKFEFVGLIDPSIEGNYTQVTSVNGDVILTYEKGRTWGSKGLNYAKKLVPKTKHLELSVGHFGHPKEFFSRYGNKL